MEIDLQSESDQSESQLPEGVDSSESNFQSFNRSPAYQTQENLVPLNISLEDSQYPGSNFPDSRISEVNTQVLNF